jgi:prepilin-type N-terminal cleavage/methylation domain-containing protein
MGRKGFTLIELIIIIVLISIVAAFAASRLGNITGSKAPAFRDKLVSEIRYAQNLAMTQNLRYRIYFNTAPAPASGYAVVNDANGDGWVTTGANEYAQDPAGSGPLRVTLSAGDYAGITVGTPADGGSGFVEFNSLGSPTAGGVVLIGVYANGAAVGNNIMITAQTGAVN